MAFLRILQNGREYRRELGDSTIIGRDAECDLRVDDPKISRVHCVIQRTGQSWIAADLDSHNGTLLGGWPLTRQPLKHGDVLQLGAASLQFLLKEDARLAAAALELANQQPFSSTTESAPAGNSTTPLSASLLTPVRKKSLWEKATHSSTVEPRRSKKRKRKTIDLEKLRAKNKKSPPPGAVGPIDLSRVAQPWYYRTVRPAIAIPASVALLLIIYFAANGFPHLGSQSKPIPASLPHSSPYNND
jgi:pSer/pThr/pTyr-binding forkhead associated (FHA) protein